MRRIEVCQFLIYHWPDIALLYLPMVKLQGEVAYHQAFVTTATILARVKRQFFTFEWNGPYNHFRAALIVLAVSYASLLAASQFRKHYLVEPAIQWHQQLLIDRAVLAERFEDNPGSIYPNVSQAYQRIETSIRMSDGWIEEDKHIQTDLSWITWLVGKLIGICLGPLIFKD